MAILNGFPLCDLCRVQTPDPPKTIRLSTNSRNYTKRARLDFQKFKTLTEKGRGCD